MFGVAWHHDGAAKGPKPIGFGNCWVVAGIIVQLPFLSRPLCLPVLARLWRPARTGKIAFAREMVETIAARYPTRLVHAVGDAAYAGEHLRGLPDAMTWTSRRALLEEWGVRIPRAAAHSAPRDSAVLAFCRGPGGFDRVTVGVCRESVVDGAVPLNKCGSRFVMRSMLSTRESMPARTRRIPRSWQPLHMKTSTLSPAESQKVTPAMSKTTPTGRIFQVSSAAIFNREAVARPLSALT